MRLFAFLFAAALALPVAAFAQAPTQDQIRRGLIGTWQSIEDTRFTRELNADGSAVDRYEGTSDAARGTWSIFTGNAPPPEAKGRQLAPQATYLEIRQNGDVLLFGLMALSSQGLQMVYLERGNQLSFTRLK